MPVYAWMCMPWFLVCVRSLALGSRMSIMYEYVHVCVCITHKHTYYDFACIRMCCVAVRRMRWYLLMCCILCASKWIHRCVCIHVYVYKHTEWQASCVIILCHHTHKHIQPDTNLCGRQIRHLRTLFDLNRQVAQQLPNSPKGPFIPLTLSSSFRLVGMLFSVMMPCFAMASVFFLVSVCLRLTAACRSILLPLGVLSVQFLMCACFCVFVCACMLFCSCFF